MLGWNLGSAPRLRKQLGRSALNPFRRARKDIDIFYRVAIRSHNENDWYSKHRLLGAHILERLAGEHRVIAQCGLPGSPDLAPPKQYKREIRRSRIAFSPFGWGEICYRDFEAVCYDCLLVKPSVSHLRTTPDIFIENETYVPVRWDLSDLEEKCRHYLKHQDEAERIISNARQRYTQYFQTHQFIQSVKDILEGLFDSPHGSGG